MFEKALTMMPLSSPEPKGSSEGSVWQWSGVFCRRPHFQRSISLMSL